MKTINQFITEKFKLSSKNIGHKYNYCPKDKTELVKLIIELIKKRGYDADLNDIDVSKITNMGTLFNFNRDMINFNGDISEWDVSNVEDMTAMFFASKFNGDISEWDVSNVNDMSMMFCQSNFNRKEDLENWNVNNVESMKNIFFHCPLEKNPPSWYKK